MVAFNIFGILILFKIITSQALLSDIKLPTQYNEGRISECVIKLFKKEVPSRSIVIIVSSNDYHKSLLQTFNTYYPSSIITRSFENQDWLLYPEVYLITVKKCSEFLTGINKLSKDLAWNPLAKFIIVCKDIKDDGSKILQVFNVLLGKNIINVVFIKNSENIDLELLTYYPYSGSHCGKNASDIRSFGSCRNLTDAPLFPDKVPNGLRNCSMFVAAREYIPYVAEENGNYSKYIGIGIEQYVFNIVAKHEGFDFELTFIDPKEGFGIILPNKTVTGLLGYLQNNKVSVILGGLFLLKSRMETFDFVYGYNYAIFGVYTPVIQEKKWTRVYRQFSFRTWMLIIVSFIFVTITIVIILSVTSGKPTDKIMIILKLWRYFYGQVDDNLFRHKHLKRILIVWIIFTNTVCAFYNTALYSLITGHVKEQINVDPNNLASLPFKACIHDQVRSFFKLSYNESLPDGDSSVQCQNPDAAFEGVGTRNDLYTIDTDYAYFLRASKYKDAEGYPTIKRQDFARNLAFSIYMTKGFPLRQKFQIRVLQIFERGLLQRHLINALAKKQKPVTASKRKYSPTEIEDFVIHFSILFFGAAVSLVTFFVELMTAKFKMF